ncbi:MAG: hypothetical protein HND57_14800 [Planctomycetes bacterium]|nr:hypothetical protein [Planctomycetota bacterium]
MSISNDSVSRVSGSASVSDTLVGPGTGVSAATVGCGVEMHSSTAAIAAAAIRKWQ